MVYNAKVGKLILFWDYDTQWGADRSRSINGQNHWGHLEFENTARLLELLSRYEVPVCFAVVAAAALPGQRPYHDPQQIRLISNLGHEVASHSMYHDWLPGIGYSELVRTLRESRDILEQCTGRPVISFVPPYNQPFDYLYKGSISFTERRLVPKDRIDLPRLCTGLRQAGFLFSRISYATLEERIWGKVFKKDHGFLSKPEKINGILCIRLRSSAGFQQGTFSMLEECAKTGKYLVIYGHPHSLLADNAQNERYLISFLRKVKQLVSAGRIKVTLPRELVLAGELV
jgi:hypothetical protein